MKETQVDEQEFNAQWDRGDFRVAAVGAMCGPAIFRLEGGREVQPFAVAPWAAGGDPRLIALPPLLRRLRGDWFCLPFGMPEARADLSADWVSGQNPDPDLGNFFHGPSANLPFRCTQLGPGALDLELDYPQAHPIARVRRRIRGVAGRARIAFEHEVTARRDVMLPVGAHPVFRLPNEPGSAELSITGDVTAYTYPVDAEPGVSRLAHGGRYKDLTAVPTLDGGALDLTRFPLAIDTEEIVLVTGATGRASLTNYAERYRVQLEWNARTFPSCNLWISNRGRTAYPWSGRHLALGIEPVASPFDLGVAVANASTSPLARNGVRTAALFSPGTPWIGDYAIEVSAI